MTSRNLRSVPALAPSRAIDPDLREACREFRQLRHELFRSQLEASIELGIGRATVERIERCESDPRGSVIKKMKRMAAERAGRKAA